MRREPASWAEAITGLFLNGILGSGGFYLKQKFQVTNTLFLKPSVTVVSGVLCLIL